jgi:hypothetical protein
MKTFNFAKEINRVSVMKRKYRQEDACSNRAGVGYCCPQIEIRNDEGILFYGIER